MFVAEILRNIRNSSNYVEPNSDKYFTSANGRSEVSEKTMAAINELFVERFKNALNDSVHIINKLKAMVSNSNEKDWVEKIRNQLNKSGGGFGKLALSQLLE